MVVLALKKAHFFFKILYETLEFPHRLCFNMVEKFCFRMKINHNTAPRLERSIPNTRSSDARRCRQKRPEAPFTQPARL